MLLLGNDLQNQAGIGQREGARRLHDTPIEKTLSPNRFHISSPNIWSALCDYITSTGVHTATPLVEYIFGCRDDCEANDWTPW